MCAIFANVFDKGEHLLPRFNFVPQQFKHSTRHVGVSHDVVLNTHQLFLSEARIFVECTVAVCDAAFDIGFGDDQVAIVHDDFLVGWRYPHKGAVNMKIDALNFQLDLT